MTLGLAPRQADLFRSTAGYCEGRVAPDSIYGILHRECFTLFPDEMFADLFDDVGWRSVPPMIVAVGPPRVFRTAKLMLIHAASCRFRYSSWTSCGVL